MPKRRIPPEIMAYLGPCREPETVGEELVEQCSIAVMFEPGSLTDCAPLVSVMSLVVTEMENLGLSPRGPKGSRGWLDAMQIIQEDRQLMDIAHDPTIPCRWCDQAFEPVIDKTLLKLFLTWFNSRLVADLLAIHRCPACGGKLKARKTMRYSGAGYTPAPGSVEDDEEWAERLLG